LPPNWTSLYELSRLDDGTLRQAYELGLITPKVTGREIKELAQKVIQGEVEPDDSAEPLPARPTAPNPAGGSGPTGMHCINGHDWQLTCAKCGDSGTSADCLIDFIENSSHITDQLERIAERIREMLADQGAA
jgi:hypothetical protein